MGHFVHETGVLNEDTIVLKVSSYIWLGSSVLAYLSFSCTYFCASVSYWWELFIGEIADTNKKTKNS